MKNVLKILTFAALAILPVHGQESSAVSSSTALVQRVLPDHSAHFICETLPAENGKDVFEIESRDGQIVLRGNNGLSIASALNWYLKYHCHAHISWCGDQLNLPNPLPVVQEKIRRTTPHTYRYAFNYCTYGYTMAFWGWDRWQRELDFMAMKGINAPLMAVGADVVCRNVYRDLGIPEKEIASYIAAPPYTGWFLMGCLDGMGGPNPESWYQSQEALQKKIMARALELGMKPVLPAFTGHVPPGFKTKFPDAKVTRLKSWGGFPGVYVLDPMDPLFRDVGARFVRESTKLFGTAHLYSADTFIETDPPSADPEYLKAMTKAVYQSMADADPKAVWFMQSWLFLHSKFWNQPRIEALLSGVTDEQMVLIDLYADAKPQWSRTKAFAGKPWLWCILNNWGGKQGMYGRLTQVGVEMPKLIDNPEAGKLTGIGTANEGGDNNPIVYEQLYEMTWRNEPVNIDQWVADYVHARYGSRNENALKAWQILVPTLYECKDKRHGPQGNFLAMPPSLAKNGGGFARADIFYNTANVREAFKHLLAASDELGEKDTYCYDLVDLGRQVMSDIAQQNLHVELRASFAAKDKLRFQKACDAWYQALRDTDTLLRSHRMFQFGYYQQFALNAGTTDATPEERAKWQSNLRRIITLWGPKNSPLFGYAQRQYGGLMADYNQRTWKVYLDALADHLDHGNRVPVDDIIRTEAEKWVNEQTTFPVEAEGNPVTTAKMIWDKYASQVSDK
ncbi:alpha-N-acetylglucosaminidase [Oceaniferula spumae]